jgi:protein-disulfide isomerase
MPTTKKSSRQSAAIKEVKPAPVVVPAATGWSVKDKIIAIQVIALTLCAFAVGLLYGKVSVYEKNGGTALNQDAAADPNAQAPAEEKLQLTEDEWNTVLADAKYAKGDNDAPVTIVEFTDFQCPFCARFYEDSYGQIMSEYVDTGKVKYISRDLPLSFHQNAENAALAARCAGDQNKYFEMHDELFKTQAAWSELPDPKAEFSKAAGTIGINEGTFASCYDSGKYRQDIADDLALAAEMGASGTPTFFINGTKLVGAQPFATFKQSIDAALAQ